MNIITLIGESSCVIMFINVSHHIGHGFQSEVFAVSTRGYTQFAPLLGLICYDTFGQPAGWI